MNEQWNKSIMMDTSAAQASWRLAGMCLSWTLWVLLQTSCMMGRCAEGTCRHVELSDDATIQVFC